MSKKKVQERIKMYANISSMPECKMRFFKIYYNRIEKLWFIHLKYYAVDIKEQDLSATKTINNTPQIPDTWSFYEEIECYDGKGWLKISNGFKPVDFENVLKECTESKFNIKDVRIKKHTV